MSTRIRFDVYGPGMKVSRGQTVGTICITADLSKRETFVNYFRDVLAPAYTHEHEKYCPWISDFEYIYLEIGKEMFEISRREILTKEEDIYI
jgi:hypothetical protein